MCILLLVYDLLQEKVLEIEYIKAIVPRKEEEPSLHDDWVSAVDGSNDGYAFKSCKGVPSTLFLYLHFMSSYAYSIISDRHLPALRKVVDIYLNRYGFQNRTLCSIS